MQGHAGGYVLIRAMTAADEAWRASLAAVTIADLAGEVTGDYGPDTFTGMRAWPAMPGPA